MKTPEILSLIAIVMSSITLTWQIISWRQTGAVVRVTATVAFIPGEKDGFTVIRASNSGRTAVTVTGFGLRHPDGGNQHQFRPLPMSEPIPYRLEPGAEGSWFMPIEGIKETCAAYGDRHQDLTAWVSLGSGKTVMAKRRGIGLRRPPGY